MKYHNGITVFMAGCLTLFACNKNNDDRASTSSPNITYEITATNRSSELGRTATTGGRITGSTITWTEGYITASEIKFEAKGDNKIEFKSKAVQHIDLFDAISTLGYLTIPPGEYEKIGFKTKLVSTGGRAAFEIRGLYLHDGIPVPIVLRIDQPIELKFEKKTSTIIDDDIDFSALHALDLHLLMHGITDDLLENAIFTDDAIVISATANKTLYEIIWKAFDEGVIKVEIKKK